jgi:hypothetical protein
VSPGGRSRWRERGEQAVETVSHDSRGLLDRAYLVTRLLAAVSQAKNNGQRHLDTVLLSS